MPESLNNNTILIIEDDIDIQTFVFRVLELEGYQVLRTGSGTEGLNVLYDTQVNLVLLDLRLPDTDGWSILEQIKAAPDTSGIPVIIFTASVDKPQRTRAIAMGAVDYLTKPLSTTELKNAITRVLKTDG